MCLLRTVQFCPSAYILWAAIEEEITCCVSYLTAWPCKGRAQSWIDGRAETQASGLGQNHRTQWPPPLTAICGFGHTVSYHTSDLPVGVA